ncbi:hypothetical protein BJ878DRAFT_311729, partial [Calycina marina]
GRTHQGVQEFVRGGSVSREYQKNPKRVFTTLSNYIQQPNHVPNMAPTTRSRARNITPERPVRARECDTGERGAFFHSYDSNPENKSLPTLAKEHEIHRSTANRWLAERRDLGSPAKRRTRPLSTVLGRNSRISTRDVSKARVPVTESRPRPTLRSANRTPLPPDQKASITIQATSRESGRSEI